MSLYDKSSLIQVPSLYKDGTLVSTIPEDRSGDFTVARGSNLAATRIGEDGYIKKGYENLLLQSNSFDTSPWDSVGVSIVEGQAGYDGSNDAWNIVPNASLAHYLLPNASPTGAFTFSFYAKANGYNGFLVYNTGAPAAGRYFDLVNGVMNGYAGSPVDSTMTDVGNGWYRCSFTNSKSSGSLSIYVSDNGTNNISFVGDGTSGVLLQDAMLNQGLVAYPYLETTTAPVQGGLLENSPRLDWSNGVPTVLVEEQRTNPVPLSEYIVGMSGLGGNKSTLDWNPSIQNPEGYYGVTEYTLNTYVRKSDIFTGLSFGDKISYSIFAKSDSNANLILGGQFGGENAAFNVNTGTLVSQGANCDSYNIIDYGNGWHRYVVNITYQDSISNGLSYAFFQWSSNTESVYLWGWQAEQDATYPTSYIPTYGTRQTRSNEVISDNFDIPTTATIYNSFYSDTAKTVFVLDQVFNVAEGLNKVAIAFSPTAVKISVGGSIVANATGTYDTTALSNIQLGSNNGTDYSNAPISGFYVFPEFLTDEELNSLTD